MSKREQAATALIGGLLAGPKARRAGCLWCKPHKLTINKKSKRRKDQKVWHETH